MTFKFKSDSPKERLVVTVGWRHRLKLLWTGKVYVMAHRVKNKPSGVEIDGVMI